MRDNTRLKIRNFGVITVITLGFGELFLSGMNWWQNCDENYINRLEQHRKQIGRELTDYVENVDGNPGISEADIEDFLTKAGLMYVPCEGNCLSEMLTSDHPIQNLEQALRLYQQ